MLVQYLYARFIVALTATISGLVSALPSAPQGLPLDGAIGKRCDIPNLFKDFFDFILGNLNGVIQTYSIPIIIGAIGVAALITWSMHASRIIKGAAWALVGFLAFMILTQHVPAFGSTPC